MKQYSLKCHCGRTETHGYTPPAINLQTCCTARAIRAQCRDFGCRFELVEEECEFTDVDRLRLGMRGERVVVNGETYAQFDDEFAKAHAE